MVFIGCLNRFAVVVPSLHGRIGVRMVIGLFPEHRRRFKVTRPPILRSLAIFFSLPCFVVVVVVWMVCLYCVVPFCSNDTTRLVGLFPEP